MLSPRISIITLGVADLAVSRAFYARLGFSEADASQESIAFFQLGNIVLALFGREALAEDAGVPTTVGRDAFTLAYNVRTEVEADEVLAFAVSCGATLIKPAQKVFWGGYSGYFADPDGHLWEVAYNPFSPLDDKGNLHMS